MSKTSTKRPAQKLLNTQNSTGDVNGNKPPSSNVELSENNDDDTGKFINTPIDNTPFRIIGNERDGFILVLGKHRLCQPQETIGDVGNYLLHNQWQVCFNMVAAMIELNEEMRKSTLENSEEVK